MLINGFRVILLGIRISMRCSINKTFTEDPEEKKEGKSNVLKSKDEIISKLEEKYSCWTKLKRVIAMVFIWKINHERKKKITPLEKNEVTNNFLNKTFDLVDVDIMLQVEKCIIKMLHLKYFKSEMKLLKRVNKEANNINVKSKDSVSNLDSYLDRKGKIRVGERTDRSNDNDECKHPVILPKQGQISRIIALWCHQKTGHAARGMTLYQICPSGFWIINTNSVIRSTIPNFMTCRSLRGRIGEQKMTELLFDRLQEEPP